MKVLIIGASGATGQELVTQALAKKYDVTAFVRSPEKFTLRDDKLTVKKGDVTDKASLTLAAKGQDAILVALGPRGLSKTVLQQTFAKNIIDVMHEEDLTRIINLSAWGAGDSRPHMRTAFKIMRYTLLLNVFNDKESAEALITNSDLDYTLVRPGQLLNEPSKGPARATLDNKEHLSIRISRADVAEFMLRQLETDKWSRKSPLIGY